MAQTTYNYDQPALTEGKLVSDRFNSKIKSGEVADSNGIALGRFMGAYNTAETKFQNLYSDQATLSLTAALVTGDDVDLDIVVNGVSTSLTTTSYASSHAATMAAIETKLEAVDGIASATVDGNDIVVAADPDTDIYIANAAVTSGGAGTAVASSTNTCTKVIIGPSVQEELDPDSNGNVTFANTEAVGALRQGNIAVQADGTINPNGSVFVRFYQENTTNKARGMLSTSAGSSPTKAIALPGYYKVEQAMSSSALGVIALNNA